MISIEILAQLRSLANPTNLAGMARFGINPEFALGISVNTLRQIARPYKKNHTLALELWDSRVHEARILASIIDDPAQVTEAQMEAWAVEFNSWDLVDQCCGNLFDKTPMACSKALDWSNRDEEFIRRAGFSLMAYLATHIKKLPDEAFEPFFAAILTRCTDQRNFVRKAVNWALRSIGKRNPRLRVRALSVAGEMLTLDSKIARWNAKDTIKELSRLQV